MSSEDKFEHTGDYFIHNMLRVSLWGNFQQKISAWLIPYATKKVKAWHCIFQRAFMNISADIYLGLCLSGIIGSSVLFLISCILICPIFFLITNKSDLYFFNKYCLHFPDNPYTKINVFLQMILISNKF